MKYTFLCILVCVALFNNARAQSATGKSKPVSVKILIDSLDRALDRIYIFPDKSKMMGSYLKSQMKKGAYKNISDPKLLADKIGSDLQTVHHDGHLRIHYDPEFLAREAAQQKNSGSPDFTEAIKQAKAENFAFRKVEILDGNIGYVLFHGFNGFIEEAKPTLHAAFRFVSNTDAVIIDLRNNGGGSPWMVKQICSYFYQERTRLNDIYERRRNKTMEFWAEPELADTMKLSMPLYILTSKHTFSAAEDFTYAMQVNKRAIIVGETTGGGAHPTGPVDVGQGFVVDIPFARSINHITQTDWEGTGVVPDIAVASDDALRKALTLALEAQAATATTDEKKKQVQWSLRALKAHEYTSTDNTIYEKYAGTYGKFSVTLREAKLYLHDFNGRTFLLKPVEGSLFLATDWLQAEFLTSASGSISLKLLGKPGWEDIYERTK